MLVEENIPLAPLTTFQVGGPARYFVQANTVNDIQEAVAFAHSRRLPLFVLGGGSNLLVSDAGFPGLVLQIALCGLESSTDPHGRALFHVGAGESWDAFVDHAVRANCAGIECLSGIPGSIGATPVQNVGAYGQEVSTTIASVDALDLQQNQVVSLDHAACRFAYRSSIFNTTAHGRFIILRVTYTLTSGAPPHLQYADLQRHFAGLDHPPSLAESRAAVLAIRARKGMLIVDSDPDSRSAGSFFKNPVLSTAQHDELSRRARERGFTLPSYPALESRKKVSAAWLVEHSGFSKGFTLGRAAISSKHALAIVNKGQAAAAEIIALKNEIQTRVEHTWGLRLEPEPVLLGF